MTTRQKQKYMNTIKNTKTWVNGFEAWQKACRITIPGIEAMDPRQLDSVLQQCYAELRKEDGSEYESDSLQSHASCTG